MTCSESLHPYLGPILKSATRGKLRHFGFPFQELSGRSSWLQGVCQGVFSLQEYLPFLVDWPVHITHILRLKNAIYHTKGKRENTQKSKKLNI